jgi:hypothetical protein
MFRDQSKSNKKIIKAKRETVDQNDRSSLQSTKIESTAKSSMKKIEKISTANSIFDIGNVKIHMLFKKQMKHNNIAPTL